MKPNQTEPIAVDPLAWSAPILQSTSMLTWIALGIALVAVAGSLWLSLGMNLIPCHLCLYQRTFVMAVAGVLGIGLLTRSGRSSPLSLLALPVAVGGLGLAFWQEWLELTNQYECSGGIFGLGTVPQQSALAQLMLVGILVFDVIRRGPVSVIPRIGLLKAGILGLLFAGVAIASVPKPQTPTFGPFNPESCRLIRTVGAVGGPVRAY